MWKHPGIEKNKRRDAASSLPETDTSEGHNPSEKPSLFLSRMCVTCRTWKVLYHLESMCQRNVCISSTEETLGNTLTWHLQLRNEPHS